MSNPDSPEDLSIRALLKRRDFVLFWAARLAATLGVQIQSVALGWPDETFPANAVVSERKPVEEATVFVGFGD